MINNYKDKKILILGLGTYGGGLGAAKFLAQQGANLIISDLKTKKDLKEQLKQLKHHADITYTLGKHPVSILNDIELVIVNPAIDLRSKIIREIKKRRIPIDTELGLFLKYCKGKVIAITGTKGKSTVATLTYKILKDNKKDVLLGGNIGTSLLTKLTRIKKSTYIVLEISSFQLDLISKKIPFYISALTNIYPDHLDRYNSFTVYKRSKLSIFKHPAQHKIKTLEVQPLRWLDKNKIRVPGQHNLKNIAIAVKIARILKIPKNRIEKSIYDFKGLEHRLEFVKKVKGVVFYNDSASTTPNSTIAALNSLTVPASTLRSRQGGQPQNKIILIAGGVHKGASLKKLIKAISQKVKIAVLFGKDADKITKSVIPTSEVREIKVKTLKQAVSTAYKNAEKGDIILFSPAMASFDQFTNAKQRGEIFKKLVERL